jgi:hypothetical protein
LDRWSHTRAGSEIAGPKGRHDLNRSAYRHGSENGKVTLGGRRIGVRRPRVRTVGDADGVEREVRLESYDSFAPKGSPRDKVHGPTRHEQGERSLDSATYPGADPKDARVAALGGRSPSVPSSDHELSVHSMVLQ